MLFTYMLSDRMDIDMVSRQCVDSCEISNPGFV